MLESRIGVCSWSLQPGSAGDLIRQCTEIGVSSVQLALTPVIHAEPGSDWDAAVSRLRASGIRILSGMIGMRGEDYSTLESIARTGGVRPDATWTANLRHVEEASELAQREGIGLVSFHAGFLPEGQDDPERAKLLDRLRMVADVFASRGVEIALETGQETAENLTHALAEIDRSNVGVNFDPANMLLYNMGDPVAGLMTLAHHVRQIHIKDAVPPVQPGSWGEEVAMGEGRVNWERFFEIAITIDPPVNFVIEREAGSTRAQDIAQAHKMVLQHVARVRECSRVSRPASRSTADNTMCRDETSSSDAPGP
jgi:L-ribulose-5-phosphate 3-epimerase